MHDPVNQAEGKRQLTQMMQVEMLPQPRLLPLHTELLPLLPLLLATTALSPRHTNHYLSHNEPQKEVSQWLWQWLCERDVERPRKPSHRRSHLPSSHLTSSHLNQKASHLTSWKPSHLRATLPFP